ncbi:MAG: nuclear transport factor 2 family protein [Acidobacteria bacterium]|nr:MAG: nuclear transport factor 2 family protein [Acidobacteriota bacterium]
MLRTAQAAENRRSWRRKWANRLALEIAWRYLQALERGETGAAPKEVLTPDVGLEEFPNLLTPLGKKCDLATALEGAERGEKVMSRQMFKIKQEIADHDRIAVEVEWVGTFAGTPWIHSGWRQMKAFFAVFLEFQEGKIIK